MLIDNNIIVEPSHSVYFITLAHCRFAYAPYQVLKSCGIKGPTPVPFFGNTREMAKMVSCQSLKI